MAANTTKGNCYICGNAISKASFKKHVLSRHSYNEEDGQECVIIKAEGVEDKSYWIYLDISASATLKTLDMFLREIWLECCGHMSGFYAGRTGNIGKATKIGSLPDGFSMHYEYDFGSTTELMITIVGKSRRPKQRKAVRLLGRNEPKHYPCSKCGDEADFICCECMWTEDNPFFCEDCLNEHLEEHDAVLPVVNSPRMGVCGYCGELDEYEFDLDKFK